MTTPHYHTFSKTQQNLMTPTHISSHNLLTNQPGNKYFSSARGTVPRCVYVCMSTAKEVTELPIYVVNMRKKDFLPPVRPHLPEPSGSHPALGAGWPRVTHVREERVSRQAPIVGVFPPMLCYMAITPAVRQGPVTPGLGGPERKRTVVTVTLSPSSADDDDVEEEKKARAEEKLQFRLYMKRNPGYFHLIPSFQIALPPSSFPALICIPRGTSPTSVFSLNAPEILQIARKDR